MHLWGGVKCLEKVWKSSGKFDFILLYLHGYLILVKMYLILVKMYLG